MDRREWSVDDVKNRFGEVVAAACRGGPQTVTKRGKPTVVIMSVSEYERLIRDAERPRQSFVEHLLAFPQGGKDFKIERIRIKPRDIKF